MLLLEPQEINGLISGLSFFSWKEFHLFFLLRLDIHILLFPLIRVANSQIFQKTSSGVEGIGQIKIKKRIDLIQIYVGLPKLFIEGERIDYKNMRFLLNPTGVAIRPPYRDPKERLGSAKKKKYSQIYLLYLIS